MVVLVAVVLGVEGRVWTRLVRPVPPSDEALRVEYFPIDDLLSAELAAACAAAEPKRPANMTLSTPIPPSTSNPLIAPLVAELRFRAGWDRWWPRASVMEFDFGKRAMLARSTREHIEDLRRALNEIRVARGLPSPSRRSPLKAASGFYKQYERPSPSDEATPHEGG